MSSSAIRSEADFEQAHAEAAERTPDLVSRALALGRRADDPAWLFAAGYQSALREVFGDAADPGLRCLAASEPKQGGASTPTRLERRDGVDLLSGHKSWIAHAARVHTLIVSAHRNEARCWVRVPRGAPGLDLEVGPSARFLPALSQGRAAFEAIAVEDDAVLTDSELGRRMRRAEPRFVSVAIAGRMEAAGVLPDARALCDGPPDALRAALRTRVEPLLDAMDGQDAATAARFRADARLFQMFLGDA